MEILLSVNSSNNVPTLTFLLTLFIYHKVLIQQAVMQVLQKRWDLTFSKHSYGFRPGRSAHQAVAQAQQYIAAGYNWTVDLDLEKFFDRVNHDKVIGQMAKRVADKLLLKLIRAFLNAGVMEKRVG